MSGTLRDDLASLKIDRDHRGNRGGANLSPRRQRGESGFGLLACLIWLIPLGLVGFAGAYAYRQYDQLRSKPEVTVGLVQSMTGGEAEKLFSAKGYLKARHQADIGAKVPGRVEKLLVEERSIVKKGDLLAVLEHREMDAMLASREAMVQRTAAEIQEVKVDLRQKEREAARARRLHSAKNVSVEEVERAEASRGIMEARLAGLEASLVLQRANVRETEASIDNMKLYAPFSGTVVEKQAEVGDIITPSAFNASLIRSAVVTLASLDEMDVETDVTESLLSRIIEGQPAEVSVGAVPGKHYRGVLRQIIPKSDRTRGTVKVKVKILDVDAHLFPELVATVHFLPDKALHNPNATLASIFVPKAAVVEENGRMYAWVLETGSRVHRRAVEVAPTNDELARVESGLKPGETVILNPAKTLRENEAVKVAD